MNDIEARIRQAREAFQEAANAEADARANVALFAARVESAKDAVARARDELAKAKSDHVDAKTALALTKTARREVEDAAQDARATETSLLYGAQRFRQMTTPLFGEPRQWVQYMTAGDSRVRHSHALLDGLIWRADNPTFRRIVPPLGFACRCSLSTLSDEDVREEVSKHGGRIVDAPPAGVEMEPGFGLDGIMSVVAVAEQRAREVGVSVDDALQSMIDESNARWR
jgi:SPP1 gp7 family putative phage head morphogenesis protein